MSGTSAAALQTYIGSLTLTLVKNIKFNPGHPSPNTFNYFELFLWLKSFSFELKATFSNLLGIDLINMGGVLLYPELANNHPKMGRQGPRHKKKKKNKTNETFNQ